MNAGPRRRTPLLFSSKARADERKLLEFARANLVHFKAPHSVTFIRELPKTTTGKIQKYVLRAQRTAIAPQQEVRAFSKLSSWVSTNFESLHLRVALAGSEKKAGKCTARMVARR